MFRFTATIVKQLSHFEIEYKVDYVKNKRFIANQIYTMTCCE